MKLFEIVEPVIRHKDLSKANFNAARERIVNSKNVEYKGSGAYGTVVSHKQHAGTVIKVSKTSLDEDPYMKYIVSATANGRASSNPYFPRVYSIKTYTGPMQVGHHNEMYTLEMEQLEDLERCNEEELMAMGRKAFGDGFDLLVQKEVRVGASRSAGKHLKQYKWTHDIHRKLHMQNKPSEQPAPYMIASILAKALQRAIVSADGMGARPTDTFTAVVDPQLKQALMIIRSILRRDAGESIFADIHSGNIMCRRTAAGPQLVITDPLS